MLSQDAQIEEDLCLVLIALQRLDPVALDAGETHNSGGASE
jgi:hypothetical protein